VIIRPDGHVESIELDRSSGLKVLDAAAFKIVRMATPFAAFPPDIRRDTDLLIITRTWFFGRGDKIWTE
jgi:protein TonB